MSAHEPYRERLWPGALGWTAVLVGAVFVGVALLPVAPLAAAVGGGVALLAAVAVAVGTSPVVEVRNGMLHAGRARVPVDLLGPVEVLDRDGVRGALGPGSDARTFAVLRAWVPGAVLVPLVDPADPTPAWLVSSRGPRRLAAAIDAARRSPRAGGTVGDDQGQAAHSEQIG